MVREAFIFKISKSEGPTVQVINLKVGPTHLLHENLAVHFIPLDQEKKKDEG